MEITYLPSERKEVVKIHCPECGERVRNVGLDPENCNLEGLSCRCKRCRNLFTVRAQSSSKN